MPAPLAVETEGFKEFRQELKAVGGEWPKQLGQANKQAAGIVAKEGETQARRGTNQQAAGASTFRSSSTQTAATVMAGSARAPWMKPALMGSRERTGWYADDRYRESEGRQFPPWVGNGWDPGESWDGHAAGEPYVIGDAIRRKRIEFAKAYEALIDDLARRAFPE
jgi:hypothetical protein